jgi:hypothetical protein
MGSNMTFDWSKSNQKALAAVALDKAVDAMFPGKVISSLMEVNGLDEGTVPKNCKILYTGNEKLNLRPTDRRAWFIVLINDLIIRLRICTAYPGSGYAEFAVIHSCEALGTEKAERALSHGIYSVNLICGKEAHECSC